MPIVGPEVAGSQRRLTPREAANRAGCTEPTIKAHIERADGLIDGYWEKPGPNRHWTVWEDSVDRVAQSGGLRGTRYARLPEAAGSPTPGRPFAVVPGDDVAALRGDIQRLAATVEVLADRVEHGGADGDRLWRDRAERLEQVLWKVVSSGGELATATADHAATSERLRAAARAQAEALNLLAEQPDAPAKEPGS